MFLFTISRVLIIILNIRKSYFIDVYGVLNNYSHGVERIASGQPGLRGVVFMAISIGYS